MASCNPPSQLASALRDVSNLLTEEDVKKLVAFTNEIESDCIQDVSEAQEFFAQIQDLGLLYKNDVDFLIDVMEDLKLQHASKPLQEYKLEYLPCDELPDISTSAVMDYKNPQKECDHHKGQTLTHFCVTCEVPICTKCFFSKHRDASLCEVVDRDNLSHAIESHQRDLVKELDSLQECVFRLKKVCGEQEKNIGRHHELIRNTVTAGEKAMQKRTVAFAEKLIKKLDEEDSVDKRNLKCFAELSQNAKPTVEYVQDRRYLSEYDSLAQLRTIQQSRHTLANTKDKLVKAQQNLTGMLENVSFKKIANRGQFGKLRLCSLVGSVVTSPKDLVNVFDARQREGGILLVSVDLENPKKELWNLMIVASNSRFPVVMSYITIRTKVKDDGKSPIPFLMITETFNEISRGLEHILLAIGRMVFIVRPPSEVIPWEIMSPYSSVTIDHIDRNSWVTSIAPLYQNYEINDRFLVSVNDSSIIRECKISGELVRTIETTSLVSSVNCIAYNENHIAIASHLLDHVVLINNDNTVSQSGHLKLLARSTTRMRPTCVIWTGAKWMVLFLSDEPNSVWKAVTYEEAGQFSKVWGEEEFVEGKIGPVSLTRWQVTGFITFADTTIKKAKV